MCILATISHLCCALKIVQQTNAPIYTSKYIKLSHVRSQHEKSYIILIIFVSYSRVRMMAKQQSSNASNVTLKKTLIVKKLVGM